MRFSYHFQFNDGAAYVHKLSIDSQTCLQNTDSTCSYPHWTELAFHQCPHCPLTAPTHRHCPIAANIAPVIEACSEVISHNKVKLTVNTEQRSIVANTTAQKALSSLLGLAMATSDCPYTRFFRPMAHFHLPVASAEETSFRAISSYLLLHYFSTQTVAAQELDFQPLLDIYKNMQIVNENLAKRIQLDSKGDASANAVVNLHLLSCILPLSLRESLEKLRAMFHPVIDTTSP